MKIGLIGLGHVGFPIARHLHDCGHEIFSWSRSDRNVPWNHSLDLEDIPRRELDVLVIASGVARPNFGNDVLELESTVGIISKFTFLRSTSIIYISSGAVYGECQIPRKETDPPNPQTTYGKAKLSAEKSLFATFGERVQVLRVGNLVDRENPYGIFNLIRNAVQIGNIELFGNPNDCRDYIGIVDFTSIIERLINFPDYIQVLNVGSGQSLMLGELASILKSELGGSLTINWSDRRIGDLGQSRLDTKKLDHLLNMSITDTRLLISNFVKELC